MDVKAALKSQYHAALTMLQQAIEQCPDPLWTRRHPAGGYWPTA